LAKAGKEQKSRTSEDEVLTSEYGPDKKKSCTEDWKKVLQNGLKVPTQMG
jgi:hypothetical protein